MNNENLVLGTLSNDAFVMVNKKLAQKIGFVEAGLLGEMIATHRMCKQNNTFFKENWFYITQPYIEKNLGIKRSGFETATKNLMKENIIEQKKMNLPAKNHYQIKWDRIIELMSENEQQSPSNSACGNPATKDEGITQASMEEISNLACGNPATIITISKNQDIKNKSNTLNLVNKKSIIDFCNSLYTKYSVGRWSKKQWNVLIDNFVNDTNWKSVEFPKAYIIDVLETIAYKHDYKRDQIELGTNKHESTLLFNDFINAID